MKNKWIEEYVKTHHIYNKQELRINKLNRIMEEKKYTITEIKNYIKKQNSLGDVLYNLTEDNIDNAQDGILILDIMSDELFLNIKPDIEFNNDNIKFEIITHIENEAMELGNCNHMGLEDLLEILGCYIPDYEF